MPDQTAARVAAAAFAAGVVAVVSAAVTGARAWRNGSGGCEAHLLGDEFAVATQEPGAGTLPEQDAVEVAALDAQRAGVRH